MGRGEWRKTKNQMDMRIKDADGNVVSKERMVLERWSEYYDQLLNADDGSIAELTDARVYGVNENLGIQMEVSEKS